MLVRTVRVRFGLGFKYDMVGVMVVGRVIPVTVCFHQIR